MTDQGEPMHERIIEGQLAPQAGPLAAYVELRRLVDELPTGCVEEVARAYHRIARSRAYVGAADRAADIAYDHLVDEHDHVVDVDPQLADLSALSAEAGHPLGGYALDLALAVLAHDQLDPADWLMITDKWRAIGAELPVLSPARPARPVRRDVGTAPVAPRPLEPEPAPVDPVAAALLDREDRKRYAKSLRRRSRALVAFMPLLFMGSAFAAGWLTSWVPLVVGLLLLAAVGVFAAVSAGAANRL